MAENLGCVADLFRPCTEEIGNCIFTEIKRQCNYMCCFSRNVEDLRKESENLKDKRGGLQKRVDEDENNALEILPEVNTWLKNVDELQENARKILKESLDRNYGCFNIKARYSSSKKAKKAIKLIEGYLQQHKGIGDHISGPPPPVAQASIPLEPTLDFTSRKKIKEDVLTALGDEKLTLIGICGMDGVGKTTLARQLEVIVKKNNLFKETVMVVVGQNVDLPKIQLEIAERLGLNRIKDKDTFQVRANDLRARLKKKQTLVILDDIWEKINLMELGIPCESNFKDCTVLLTSRQREVLTKMSAKSFGMESLSSEEAWDFFKDESGISDDDFDLVSIARELAEECKGLPLAIKNVSCALKDKEKRIWKHALDRLKDPNPKNVPGFLNEVYQPLKLSYDFLKDQVTKLLLQLCSQFPEDFNVSLEVLTLYSFGLDWLRADSLIKARNEVVTIIDTLINSFLLLKGEHENTVKVHDITRDVVRIIALQEGLVVDTKHKSRVHGAGSCQWIFEFPEINNEFPGHLMGYNFPNLFLLVIHKELGQWNAMRHNYYNDCLTKDMLDGQKAAVTIRNFSFIENMKDLHVLSFKEMSFKALPQSMESLKKLQALYLYNCTLKNISIVGKLFTLELLSCIWCTNIEEMPPEIGKLKQLKLLDFSYCTGLKKISRGIISTLTKLEELKMLYSFDGWESTKINENERRNVALKELESLEKLMCLEIQIKDVSLLKEEFQFPSFQNFKIMFGQNNALKIPERSLVLYGLEKEIINVPSWIHKLLRDSEGLCFEGDCPISLSKLLHQLEMLEIKNCEKIEVVFINEGEGLGSPIIFRKLRTLSLFKLTNLTTFGKEIESIEFPVLKMLDMIGCPKLASMVSPMKSNEHEDEDEGSINILLFNQKVKFGGLTDLTIKDVGNFTSLFSSSIAENLANLKSLWIENCKEMEQLVIRIEKKRNNISIEIEEDDGNKKPYDKDNGKMTPIIFPKLTVLWLRNLSSLTSMGKEIKSIEFPMLNELDIESCPNFKSCVCSSIDDNISLKAGELHNYRSPPLFCNFKVKFGGLTILTIDKVHNFTSLFSSSMVQNLVNLNHLDIENCKKMEQLVIGDEKNRNNISVPIEEVDKNNKQNDEEDANMTPITFPKLEYLHLLNLSRLTSMGKEIESIEFSLLNYLHISACRKFKSCICSSMDNNTNSEVDQPHHNQSLHLFCNPKVKFGTLTSLLIEDVDNFTSLFSFSMAQNLVNLKDLRISDCKEMEQLVTRVLVEKRRNNISIKIEEDDENNKQYDKSNGKMTPITFPKLEDLSLTRLSSLTSIGKEIESIEFPILNQLDITSCPKFKSCVCCSMNNNTNWEADKPHDNRSLHLFCNSKVKFNELKVLQVWGYEDVSNMWCQHISLCFFQTLEELRISGCNSIENLFSSSIAETLIMLKGLEISNCERMEQVIAGDKEIQEHSILFPRLKVLELEELPLLRMLCEWRCALECPLLERITIESCPRMECLTQESLNTPMLSYMKIDNQVYGKKDFNGMKDLNSFLQQNITTIRKQESSSSVAMEHGEIEEES